MGTRTKLGRHNESRAHAFVSHTAVPAFAFFTGDKLQSQQSVLRSQHNSFAGRAPNFIRHTRASLITRPTFVCKNNFRHAAPRFIFQHGL